MAPLWQVSGPSIGPSLGLSLGLSLGPSRGSADPAGSAGLPRSCASSPCARSQARGTYHAPLMTGESTFDPYAAPRADLETGAPRVAVLASPWRRLAAYVVNQMALGAALLAGFMFIEFTGDVSFENGPDAFIDWLSQDPRLLGRFSAPLLLLVAVQLVLLARSSTTLGKALFGLRIVRRDGRRAALWRLVLLRFLTLAIGAALVDSVTVIGGSLVFWLVDPLMVFTRHHRTLHDRIADTIVIRTR
jgi:uncharacterized RDD family membrane protein YckC